VGLSPEDKAALDAVGISYFGDLEERLGRLLDLQGSLGPLPALKNPQAVIVAQDASGVGYGGKFRGRQWVLRAGPVNGGAAVPNIGIRATADVLIEGMRMVSIDPAVPLTHTIRLYGRTEAMASEPIASSLGTFFERANVTTEAPPILVGAFNAVAPTGGFIALQESVSSAIVTVPTGLDLDFLVPLVLGNGCGMNFASGLVTDTNLVVELRGRVL